MRGGVALEGFDLGIGNKYWNCCGPDRHRSKHPLQYSERQKTLQQKDDFYTQDLTSNMNKHAQTFNIVILFCFPWF